MTTILHILQHSLGRDKYGKSKRGQGDCRNHFCTGPGANDFALCREAVSLGLMQEHAPRTISGGDHIFTVTAAGKAYIAQHSPPEPKLSRGKRRYREYLNADLNISFGQWLRCAKAKGII